VRFAARLPLSMLAVAAAHAGAPPQWPGYNSGYDGQRYSTASQLRDLVDFALQLPGAKKKPR
jgi:hypothetical protein